VLSANLFKDVLIDPERERERERKEGVEQ